MASRSSNYHLSNTYGTSRRGRELAGDIGMEHFPEKYEETDMDEDPDLMSDHYRDTIKSWTNCDNNSLLASDLPRRDTHGGEKIALRSTGARVGTEAYANVGWDNQFHDKDPRGILNEVPWNEYRRHVEAQIRRTDFKDDGDYTTTGGGIHPDTLYKLIRSAQSWTKARLKIFDTSYEGQHRGGVGVYPDVSKVFKSEYEDTSVMTDGTRMSETYEDPINRQRTTMRLSNMVHGGGEFRVLGTTDHKVMVASYGKLLKSAGLINHETQLRLIEDDTMRSKIEALVAKPVRGIAKFMEISAKTKAADDSPASTDRFRGAKYEEMQVENHNTTLTKDILALLGLTQQEIRIAEVAENKNRKGAEHMVADLYNLVEVVHRQPISLKLQMREELLLGARGLVPGNAKDLRNNREQVIVNPKIVTFMELMSRKTAKKEDQKKNMEQTEEEQRNQWISDVELFVSRTAARDTEDIRKANNKVDAVVPNRGGNNKRTFSYKNVDRKDIGANRNEGKNEQILADAGVGEHGKNSPYAYVNETLRRAINDNEFGENKKIERHIGKFGSKYNRRDMIDTIPRETEKMNVQKKNPKQRE
jgi:hypothetical protein